MEYLPFEILDAQERAHIVQSKDGGIWVTIGPITIRIKQDFLTENSVSVSVFDTKTVEQELGDMLIYFDDIKP